MSPLVICRLLLVFDYLLFQFNEPVEQLTEQVGGQVGGGRVGGGGCSQNKLLLEGVCFELVNYTAATDSTYITHTHR